MPWMYINLTGCSGAGKTTIAAVLEDKLVKKYEKARVPPIGWRLFLQQLEPVKPIAPRVSDKPENCQRFLVMPVSLHWSV